MALRKTLFLHPCPEEVRWPVVGDWSSTENDENNAYCLVFNSDGDYNPNANHNKNDEWGVRFLQN